MTQDWTTEEGQIFEYPTTTKCFEYNEELGKVVYSFRYYVDGICIKEMLFEDNNGKAGTYISTTSIIPKKGIQ